MLIDTINYIITGYGFWSAMGWVAGCGVFIGVIIHNGDLKSLWKGILSFGFYAGLITYTTYLRINMTRDIYLFQRHPQSTASLVTNVIVALFYLLGMIIGVITIKIAHWWWRNRPMEIIKKKLCTSLCSRCV